MCETNGNFDSCNSCKRLATSRLHELHESKFPFVSCIEFIRSTLPIFFCSCIRSRGRGRISERWPTWSRNRKTNTAGPGPAVGGFVSADQIG